MTEPTRVSIVLPRSVYVLIGVGAALGLVYFLRGVLTPVFLAFTIAYILDPLVDRLEAWRLPRPLGIVVVLCSVAALVALLLSVALPALARDLAKLGAELPSQLLAVMAQGEQWLERHGVALPHSTTEWAERVSQNASALASSVLAPASGALGAILGGTFSVLGSAVAALIVPVLSVYLLNDFDRITAGVHALLPERYRERIAKDAQAVDQVLSQFLRGQLTVMAILALLYSGLYALLGVRLALLIGISSGILSFIPYVGSAFALSAGLLMSLLGGWHPAQLLGVALAYAAVQSCEGFVITPRIVGKTVGLKGIWVLLSLFVGGELFGFLGVLLAVPAAAVAKIFVARAVQNYLDSALYRTKGEESP